jgi:colanic acid biosynthesis protein WcaH
MEPDRRNAIFAELDAWAKSPQDGLPHELFRFVSRLVPLVNVDLLIQDERRGTLLTWRHDENYGPGWHVPGGIIRYRETAAARIRATALRELEAEVEYDPEPIRIQEVIDPARGERGHFISLLYRCRLIGAPGQHLRAHADPKAGDWAWHRECPANLIPEQKAYRELI